MITRECYNCGDIFEIPELDIIMNDNDVWFCSRCTQEETIDESRDSKIDP